MARRNRIVTVAIALFVGVGPVWGVPQNQGISGSALPPYTVDEYNAYTAALGVKDPVDKLRLLNNFIAAFPMSRLLVFAYHDASEIYFRQRNYPKAIETADKLIPMPQGEPESNTKLASLILRAEAFLMGCDKPELQTPEAYAAARDAATQGQQTVGQLEKPALMSDDAFATQKRALEMPFKSARRTAEAGLRGQVCTPLPPPPERTADPGPGAFDRLLDRLAQEQK